MIFLWSGVRLVVDDSMLCHHFLLLYVLKKCFCQLPEDSRTIVPKHVGAMYDCMNKLQKSASVDVTGVVYLKMCICPQATFIL